MNEVIGSFFRYVLNFKHLSKTARSLLYIVGVYSVLLVMDYSSDHKHHYTLCIFKNITGYACPGCGMGRGTLAIFSGNFVEAFSYNILCIPLTLSVFCTIIWLIFDLINNKDTFFTVVNRPMKPLYLIPFFLITIISWAVNIIRGI